MTAKEASALVRVAFDMWEKEWDCGEDWSDAHEARDMAISALQAQESSQNVPNGDFILRKAAIDALWKALYEYEDRTEKQFVESDDLDVRDWIVHRIFVQNMSDIDRQVILGLPSAQSEIIRCKDCKHWNDDTYCQKLYEMGVLDFYDYMTKEDDFCSWAERRTDE